jgi:hypothetical protein
VRSLTQRPGLDPSGPLGVISPAASQIGVEPTGLVVMFDALEMGKTGLSKPPGSRILHTNPRTGTGLWILAQARWP